MAREIDPSRPLDREVRRQVRRRLCDAIAVLRGSIDSGTPSVEDAVHRARRHGKDVRSLVRLLDAHHDVGARLDRVVRDAARSLAPLRDAHVAVELAARTGLATPAAAHGTTVDGTDGARAAADRAAIEEAIAGFEHALTLVPELRVDHPDDRLCRGLRRTYGRSRRAYERARRRPSPRRLHRWRIWNKRLWYQVRFLTVTAPSVLGPFAELLDRVGETLGDVHDLDVHLREHRDLHPELDTHRCATIEGERAALVERAVRWGATLHVERPSAFAARLSGLWAIAGREGPEPAP